MCLCTKTITKEKDNKFKIILEILESDNKKDLIYKEEFKKNIEEYKKRIEIKLEIEEKGSNSEKTSKLK